MLGFSDDHNPPTLQMNRQTTYHSNTTLLN